MSDLIERQAAIDAVYKCSDIFAGDMPVMVVKADAYEALAQLPSAQPERTDKHTETHACDCISRQAAIDATKHAWAKGLEPSQYIEDLPSVQPDIIRCKDCKYWMPYDWMFSEVWQSKNMDDYPEDEIGCQYCDMAMKADDFCSRGERKTDER